MFFFRSLYICALLLFLCSCSGPVEVAGGVGTETGNTIAGVVHFDGVAVPGVRVNLYPENFNPVKEQLPDSLQQVTANDGKYNFKISRKGRYNVVALSSDNKYMALIQAIEIPPEGKNKIVTVSTVNLSMRGIMKIHLEEITPVLGAYLYIPGTAIYAPLDSADWKNGFLRLPNVPLSNYGRIFYSSSNDTEGKNILKDSLLVETGKVAVVGPYRTWQYTERLILNTSVTGVNILENVYDYPLLVRLNSGNFDFSKAQANGEDLRFTKSNGVTPLKYQIESWDSALAEANIWVKVDTLLGNNNTQTFFLFSGNLQAQNRSSGPDVFESRYGNVGVWHLQEAANTQMDGFKDASSELHHGIGDGFTIDGASSGIIGKGRIFDGENDFISCPLSTSISGDSAFTISFWMNYGATPNRRWILYFGALDSTRGVQFTINDRWVAAFGVIGSGGTNVGQNVFDMQAYQDNWALVTTVREPQKDNIRTYINGALVDSKPAGVLDLNSSGNVVIGRPFGNNIKESLFKGSLDELRISKGVYSEARVKLDYELQKPNSNVISITEVKK